MVELTSNERILRAMIRHQVGLLQFSGGVRDDVWALLDATEADMRAQIANRLRRGKSVPARLRQMEMLFTGLRETRAGAWSDVNDAWLKSFRELSVAEAKLTAGIVDSSVPVELSLGIPDAARLRSIVRTEPFMGATLSDWANGIQQQDIDRIQTQIRMGLSQGEDIPAISRRVVGTVSKDGVDGATAITRRHSQAITRTATNSIAAASRRELYAVNRDLLSGELFAATLDSRTTPICRSLDGKVYATDDPQKPHLPLHWNERSLLLPIVDGEVIGERPRKDYTEQQLVREYAKANGLDIKVPSSARGKKARELIPAGHKGKFDAFARKRVRELTGTAPAKLTYQEWLKGQPAQFQDDILGPARGKLFREENFTLDRFVSPQGKQITLRELALDDVASVKSMGLTPSPYTEDFASGPSTPLSSKPPKAKGTKKAQPSEPTPDELAGLPTAATATKAAKAQAAIGKAAQAQAAAAAKAAEKAAKAQAVDLAKQAKAQAAAAQKLAAQQAKAQAVAAKAAAKAQAKAQAALAAQQLKATKAAEKAAAAAAAKQAKAQALAAEKAAKAKAIADAKAAADAAKAQAIAEAAAAKAAAEKASAQAAANAALDSNRVLDTSKWTQVSGKKGSNPGGVYRDETGAEWYVKEAKSADHRANEVLASRLYNEAGVDAIQVQPALLNGKPAVASRMAKVEGVADDLKKKSGLQAKAREGFSADAWLANWDVVGADFDNLTLLDHKLTRVDTGGSLLYRAQGGAKGSAFGMTVKELDTLRGIGVNNPQASAVFGTMTDLDVIASSERFLKATEGLTQARVVKLAKDAGFDAAKADELAETLMLRRKHIEVDAHVRRVLAEQRAVAEAAERAAEVQRQADIAAGRIPADPHYTGAQRGRVFKEQSSEYVREYSDWIKSLTREEQDAFTSWQGSGYKSMVAVQRGTPADLKGFAESTRKNAKKQLDHLYAGLNRAPRLANQELFRGIHFSDAHGNRLPSSPEVLAQNGFVPGNEVTLPSVSSWSKTGNVARGFGSVVFRIKKKRASFDLSRYSPAGHKAENESMLLKGERYRVVSITKDPDSYYKDGLMVDLEEI